MKKLLAILLVAVLTFSCGCGSPKGADVTAQQASGLSEDRLKTIGSIQKISDYDDLNLYTMEVYFDYNLDNLTPVGLDSDEEMLKLVLQEALPGVEVEMTAPNYGCSAFTLEATDGKVYFGRNYDFKLDTSAMQIYCHPKDGYASVGYTALDNLSIADPLANEKSMATCLAAPFICLDGMNEKGVGIAVLTLSSDPTRQDNGKPVLATPFVIRLVLDRCATTQEAVDLLSQYDYYSTSGRDYHYYITDASGDSRVVEWDCESETREMVVTPMRTITNYFAKYEDKVLPNQTNGIYGRGLERKQHIEETIEAAGDSTDLGTAWDAAKSAAQTPDPESIVSNTQWTVVYNLTDMKHEFVLHRHWEDVYKYDKMWK